MTQTYSQLQKQIDALQREAEKLRETEVKGVVERIKVAIAQYNLTAAQLGFRAGAAGAGKAGKGKLSARVAKYSDGSGGVWSGRGPHPHWLRDALLAGKKLEDFATGSSPVKATGAAPVKAASGKTNAKAKGKGKRKAKAQYRDPVSGNRWGGFGPRPRWLREAIEGGKKLEQFVV